MGMKLKEFYKQIDVLVEEPAKLTEEEKEMKVEHKGYTLTIEEIRDSEDNFVKYISCCNQINHFDTWKANDLNIIIVKFKREIDNLLTKKEEEMNSKVVTAEDISHIFTEMEAKYGKDKAIGILVGTTQESVPLINGKSAAQILFEKLQEHQNREKEDKSIMKITCVYKSYPIEITKEEGSPYFKCTLIGDVWFPPQKLSNDSLERLLHWYKGHIDKFNTGIPGHLMSLTIEYGDRTLGAFEYDPNINKVLNNYMFLTKKGEEGSLDKLVVRFQEEVDKEKKDWVYKKRVKDGLMVKIGSLVYGRIMFDKPKLTTYYTSITLSSKYYLNWFTKKDDYYLEVVPNTTPSKTLNFKEVICIEENSEPKTIGYFTDDSKVFYYDQYVEPSEK